MEYPAKEKAIVYASRKEKAKGKVSSNKGENSKKPSTQGGLDEELIEEELEAYIEEEENAGGEFPLNKDVTLRQDVLSNHLAELLVCIMKSFLHEGMIVD